jgi:hypothetical protein
MGNANATERSDEVERKMRRLEIRVDSEAPVLAELSQVKHCRPG